jgi:putative PIN family toxin of toxin-antitoxin system
MRVVVDTNVFVSAVFFGGIPARLLDMWRNGSVELLLTAEILAEYEDVVHRLRGRYPSVDPDPIINLVVRWATFVQPAPLEGQVCADPDDDKFLAAALGGAGRMVVSGDTHLRAVNGYRQVEVLTPAEFIRRYGSEPAAGADSARRGSAQP